MPVKVRGTKSREESYAQLMREHPLLGTPEEQNAYLDSLNTVPELKHAVKLLARTVALLVQHKL